MESFSNEERRKIIQFTWGRSRLPPKGKGWDSSFQISKRNSNELPSAATCSFCLFLPEYSNYETLEKNLRIIINYGLGSMLNN